MGQCQGQFHFTANNIVEACFHKDLNENFLFRVIVYEFEILHLDFIYMITSCYIRVSKSVNNTLSVPPSGRRKLYFEEYHKAHLNGDISPVAAVCLKYSALSRNRILGRRFRLNCECIFCNYCDI